ncbi:MAG TPA: DMT family transporter [Candidatus Nitrosocosmicus sp.]|nr:DMT family transporter [Candidatus Nitrosocosmicus sp.]
MEALLISMIPMIGWGMMWFFATKATREMDPFQSQFLFQLVGIPMLLLLLPFVFRGIQTENLPLIIGLGFFETFVLTLYFYALKIGKLTIVGPIGEMYLLVTILLTILITHESLYFLKGVAIISVLAGVILLGLQLNELKKSKKISLYQGVLPALIAAFGTGIFVFFVGISSRVNGWYMTSLGIRVMIVLTILVIFLIQKKNLKNIFKNVPWRWVLPAAFFDVLAFTTFNYALMKYEISYVSVMSAGAPVITVVLAYLFLKERIIWYQIIGLFLVIGGIIILNLP